MTTARGRVVAALALLAAAAAGLGCGDNSHDNASDPIAAVVERALDAHAARDVEALCATLSDEALEVLGRAAHSARSTCDYDLRRVLRWMEPNRGEPQVGKAHELAGRARVAVTLGDGTRLAMPMVREHGDWKLDGLYGATLSRIQVRGTDDEDELRVAGTVPTRRSGESELTPLRRGEACPDPGIADFPQMEGRCTVEVSGEELLLAVRTPFGTLDFARCKVSFHLHVDGRGDAWVARFAISGTNPCLDAMACMDQERQTVPWRGRLAADGNGGHRLVAFDLCLDTCLGRFEGDLELKLDVQGNRWRVDADAAMVGASGWLFHGGLRSSPTEVALR